MSVDLHPVHRDGPGRVRLPFADRRAAGVALARVAAALDLVDPVVLALPRGGVEVAAEVARALDRPLEVFVVRKIGHPRQPELAIGAVAEGGVMVLDETLTGTFLQGEVDRVRRSELAELERRVRVYRQGRPAPDVRGREVLLVDDGLATGATAAVAVAALRTAGARRVVVAVPVASADAVRRLQDDAEVAVVAVPVPFGAVGHWYAAFPQVSDRQVLEQLARGPASLAAPPQIEEDRRGSRR